MNTQAEKPRMPDEVGVPDPFPFMHPTLKANYGNWDWHDRPRPGVLHHVSKSGDEIWTVRAGTQRQMDVFTIRKLADIGDEFADGHRPLHHPLEHRVHGRGREQGRAPDRERWKATGFPVGGTGASVSMISHTQGWLHCDIPGTDASGVVKSLMDMLHQEFVQEKMPNRVRITTSCCQINCGGQGDIADQRAVHQAAEDQPRPGGQRLRTPRGCGALPGGRDPARDGQRQALAGSRREEMRRCGACYPPCPPMQINGDEFDQDRDLGGRQALQRALQADVPQAGRRQPAQQPAALAGGAKIVRKIVEAYKADAKHWERMGEWIDRIGWNRFFENDRPRVHQTPPRYMDRCAQDHEHVGPRPLLTRQRSAKTKESQVKIGVLICEGPYTHQAADIGLSIRDGRARGRATKSRGCSSTTTGSTSRRGCQPAAAGRAPHPAELDRARQGARHRPGGLHRRRPAPRSARRRRGQPPAARTPTTSPTGSGFPASGQLIEMGIQTDRLVTFGD